MFCRCKDSSNRSLNHQNFIEHVMGRTGMGMAIGKGVCWEYMFIGTGMKTGTGTGTINTFTLSSAEQLLGGR